MRSERERFERASAGASPKMSTASTTMTSVNRSTGQSSATRSIRGIARAASNRKPDRVHAAIPMPSAPPSSASSAASVSIICTIRRRLAPIAERTATSALRSSQLAYSRFAMFTHAMRSTAATAPSSTRSPVRTGPTVISSRDWRLNVNSTAPSGYWPRRRAASTAASSRADARETPGESLPTACRTMQPRTSPQPSGSI